VNVSGFIYHYIRPLSIISHRQDSPKQQNWKPILVMLAAVGNEGSPFSPQSRENFYATIIRRFADSEFPKRNGDVIFIKSTLVFD
jgi:hypothetical protein